MSQHRDETMAPIPYRSKMQDGTPFISVYLGGEVSFEWTGQWFDPIEVKLGGYGEPTQFLISVDHDNNHSLYTSWTVYCADHNTDNPAAMLTWFREVCSAWLVGALCSTGYEGYAVEEV